jgi:hypothetical protein
MDSDFRKITVLEAEFRYRVKRLETDFQFADASIKTFTNWDIKGVRERHYMEEYVEVAVEDYLRTSVTSGEITEYGITPSDIKKFIETKSEFFEDLLLEAAADIPLDVDDE